MKDADKGTNEDILKNIRTGEESYRNDDAARQQHKVNSMVMDDRSGAARNSLGGRSGLMKSDIM